MHQTSLSVASSSSLVQVVFGGTNIMGNVRNMERQMPCILVATPGHLVELLEFKIRGRPLKNVLSCSRGRVAAAASPNPMMVWLDEADLLLDSFGPELRRIMQVLPRKQQTLLFSHPPLGTTATDSNQQQRRTATPRSIPLPSPRRTRCGLSRSGLCHSHQQQHEHDGLSRNASEYVEQHQSEQA